MHTLLLNGVWVAVLSFWFNTCAIVLPYWWSVEKTETEVGLFKVCNIVDLSLNCTRTDSLDHVYWFQAVQAMLMLASITLFAGIALSSYYIFFHKYGPYIVYITASLVSFGGLASLIGLIVFSSMISLTFPDGQFMSCFGLNIISVVLSSISGGIFVFSLVRDTC